MKDKVWEEYKRRLRYHLLLCLDQDPQNFSSYDKTYDYNNNFIERIILIGDQAIDAQATISTMCSSAMTLPIVWTDSAARTSCAVGLGNDTYLVDTETTSSNLADKA